MLICKFFSHHIIVLLESNAYSCYILITAPGPVEDLTVVGYGPYQVNLTWRETLAQNGEVVKHMIEYSAKKVI